MHEKCHTPRRNPEVDSLINSLNTFKVWAESIKTYFGSHIFPIQHGSLNSFSVLHAGHQHRLNKTEKPTTGPYANGFNCDICSATFNTVRWHCPECNYDLCQGCVRKSLDLTPLDAKNVFIPIVPLFHEANSASIVPHQGGSLVPFGDISLYLDEQKRSFKENNVILQKLAKKDGLFTITEAQLCSCMSHIIETYHRYESSVNYIESLLRQQLIAAIGKEVSLLDLNEYMVFHFRKLFKEEYQPSQFCYSVRAGDNCPEGTLTLQSSDSNSNIPEPIVTTVRRIENGHEMGFMINASTRVNFKGTHFLHGYIQNQFSDAKGSGLELIARSNQFCCYFVMIGRIASATLFDPISSILIQNKDELIVPLLLDPIPAPKAFKDAIASLSPEQQRFAKAYRGLQLASTLFGIVILPVKPQVERVLNLPPNSLAKEIKLTRDLLQLFINYNISSDLLAYQGDPDVDVSVKRESVRKAMQAVEAIIEEAKEIELEKKREIQRLAEEKIRREEEERRMKEQEEEERRRARETLSRQSLLTNYNQAQFLCEDLFSSAACRPTQQSMTYSSAPGMAYSSMPQALAFSAGPSMWSIPTSMPILSSLPLPTSLPAPTGQPPKVSEPLPPKPVADKSPESKPAETKKPIESSEIADFKTSVEDYSKIPKDIDAKFLSLDVDACLRPTIINPADEWKKKSVPSIISKVTVEKTLKKDEKVAENKKALDLMDALTKSGALAFHHSQLHVVLAATHCFDQTLLDTIIQKNVNPVEKIERSALILATTLQKTSAVEIVNPGQLLRVSTYSPGLF